MKIVEKKSMDMKRDMMSLLRAAWGILEGIDDHEDSPVAVIEFWRADKLKEELAKWEGWYSPLDKEKPSGKKV